MDNKESSPFNAFDCTGTPMTGSVVFAATIPGKCAAPPAPAIMTLSPLPLASVAYSNIKSGVRCADTTCFSYGMFNSSKISHACFIVSQSDVLPMMTPTSGFILSPPLSYYSILYRLTRFPNLSSLSNAEQKGPVCIALLGSNTNRAMVSAVRF
ncbi:hypothetical protein C883_3335 [Bacillus stratosphericus LAMA 585]|nr:hypothetical protein C883_3335 [Bacillus stratosphericus LAMA 585]